MPAALSVLVIDRVSHIQTSELDQIQLKQLIDEGLHNVARDFEISVQILLKEFLKFKSQDMDKMKEAVLLLTRVRQKLIDVSNAKSRLNLIEVLETDKHPNLFIMSGIAHEPVFVER